MVTSTSQNEETTNPPRKRQKKVSAEEHEDSQDMDAEPEEEDMGTPELVPLDITNEIIGQWVRVKYEGEIFIGKVLGVEGGEAKVQCLELPFLLHEPSSLESVDAAELYSEVYASDVPKLKKFGRQRKYIW